MFYFFPAGYYSDNEIFRSARSYYFKGYVSRNGIENLMEARVLWRVATRQARDYLAKHKSKTK